MRFSIVTTIRCAIRVSMTKTCIWFGIAFFRHNTYVQYDTIQISNGISCDVHSLFTPDAEIMPGCYASCRDAPETQSYFYFPGKKSIYLWRRRTFSRFLLGMYIYPRGLLWPGPASLKPVQENSRRNISPITGYISAMS